MTCRETRIALERGEPSPDVEAHLAACADCRGAAAAVREVDALLGPLLEPQGDPDPQAVARTVEAVTSPVPGTRRSRVLLAVAASLVLLLGGALAGWLLRGWPVSTPGDGLTARLAEHERQVFAEVREALGGDLGWLATIDGEVVVGIARNGGPGPLRVVLLEIRDDAGAVVARPRLVLPQGRRVEIDVPGHPWMLVEAAGDDGRRLALSVRFRDGAELTTPNARIPDGETAFLGEVRTDGAVRAVYVALY